MKYHYQPGDTIPGGTLSAGGRIRVTSPNVRCGTCFWFTGEECEHFGLNGVREVEDDSYLGEGCAEGWYTEEKR